LLQTNLSVARKRTISGIKIMKSLIQAVVIAATLAAPVAVFAQSNQPLTRAQVHEQLVQIEKAGYNPARNNPNEYPSNIQAAEARVAAQNTAVGGVAAGSSQQGSAVVAQ
jgi:Domain of unknown function (DUF4148)